MWILVKFQVKASENHGSGKPPYEPIARRTGGGGGGGGGKALNEGCCGLGGC